MIKMKVLKVFLLGTLIILWGYLSLAYAEDVSDAQKLADEYTQELKKRKWPLSEYKVALSLKAGLAKYEEQEQNISSDYAAFYPEAALTASSQSEGDIETTLTASFGKTSPDVETWRISSIKYQTNDMDFYRLNLKGAIGKILYSDKYQNLRVIPFLGYGWRFIEFKRTNFNILDVITSRHVVTEKYLIHHLDFGIKLDNKLMERLEVYALAGLAYVFFNQADNSALGKIRGAGGFLVEGNIGLQYSLTSVWKLLLGGFVELQDLRGGSKGTVIWPDNKLNIYAGNLGMRLEF